MSMRIAILMRYEDYEQSETITGAMNRFRISLSAILYIVLLTTISMMV